jgi:uncharacterized protein
VNLDTRPARRRVMLAAACLALATVVASGVAGKGLKVEPLDIVTAHGVFHFKVEVADNDATRERGLMFRKTLAADRGMLFDFKAPKYVAFWMKNTLIPLDMLFIAADGHIVSIARDAVPMSEVPIPSGGEALGVLELRGGRAAEIDAQPGDRVRERIFHH